MQKRRTNRRPQAKITTASHRHETGGRAGKEAIFMATKFPPFEKAEILCVGTELLMGDIVNTNAAFLSRELLKLGVGVYRQSVVGDNAARLAADLRDALSRTGLVLLTGGLGPTFDDLTKETAAAVFGRRMVLHEESLARIRAYFAATGREMTENNEKQAWMPEGAAVFQNNYGTAPGLALTDEEGRTAVLLPGPPREAEPMFREEVVPFLRPRAPFVLFSRNLHFIGVGESALEAMLPADIRESANPTVAPYCTPGDVRLRVSAKAETEEAARALCDGMIEKLRPLPFFGSCCGMDLKGPEEALLSLLLEKGKTVSAAESCTGGLILKRLTDLPGASAAVAGGAVTYQTREKTGILGVDPTLIKKHTVVSEPVALAMAQGALRKFGTDLSIATTGYAGPGGGTEKEPVGTVYVAVCDRESAHCMRLSLSSARERSYIREVAATRALFFAFDFLRAREQNC